MRREQAYYPAIDWLRLAAALAVLAYHLGWSTAAPGGETRLLVGGGFEVPGREGIWRHLWVGVPVFFVISGFVIAGSAEGGGAAHFLRRRIERLYPAIFVCAPLSALIWAMAGRSPLRDLGLLAKSLLLLPGAAWIEPPYWTLGVEIAFYAWVVLLLLVVGERGLKPGAIAMVLASAILWAGYLVHGSAPAPVWIRPVYWGMDFALGLLLYFARAGRLGGWGAAAAVAAGATGALQAMQLFHAQWTSFVPVVIWLGGVAVVGLAPRRRSSRDHPASRLAGLTTYPLYLLHYALGLGAMSLLVRAGAPPLAAMAAAGALAVALAVAVALYAEPAARRLLKLGLDRFGFPR
ncbi:MAG: acyltransferase family protein [Allosphingosinicella sp.]